MTSPEGGEGTRAREHIARVVVVVVSLVVAFHAGGLVAASWGLLAGIGVGIAVFVGAFFVQQVLRASSLGHGWTIAVVVHLFFWAVRGVQTTTLRAPGDVRVPSDEQRIEAGPPLPFSAGVGESAFDLPAGTPIAGWGRGERRAAWPHLRGAGPLGRLSLAQMEEGRRSLLVRGEQGADRLGARALVLRPERGPALAICRLDLVVSDSALHDAVLRRVSGLGFHAETLLLSATHTHSGPGGFARVRLACLVGTDHHDPVVFERIADAAAEAIRSAHESAEPARIGFVRSRDRGPDGRPVLAKNRRGGAENADRIDDEVLGIRVDAADGDRRIALVLNYAVHPIWLRPRSRVFSQDLAGALERSEAIGDGAMVLFVNGAEGDISPRVRPEPDAATAIADFEAAVAEDLSPRATSDLLDIVPVVVRRDMGSAHAYVTWGPRARFAPAARSPFGEGVVGFGAAVLSLPANVAIWGLGVPDVRAGFTFDGSVGLVASLDSYLDGTVFSFGAVRLETPEATAAIVWMPVEATHTVGRAIREAAAVRGADPVFLFGLTNGAMGYCCSHDEYFEGGYESLSTLFGPDTSVLVREACEAALDAAR